MIKQSNPSFLNEFGKEIQSGNHLLIKSAIDKGANAFYKSLMMLPEVLNNKDEIAKTSEILKDLDLNQFTENNKINRKKLEVYIVTKMNENEVNRVDKPNSNQVCAVLAIVLVANLAVVANIAVVAAVAVAFVIVLWVASAKLGKIGNTNEGNLRQNAFNETETNAKSEMIIDVIANKLSLNP